MSQVGPLIHGFGKGYYRSLLDWRRGCVYKSIQVKIPDDWKPVRKPSFIPSNRQIHVGELIYGSPRRLDRTILKHMFDATVANILKIPLSETNNADQFIWAKAKTGIYTVKIYR
jgi:hypothetical protein